MTVRYQPELIAAPLTPRMAEAVQINFESLFADLTTLDTTVAATLVSLGTALTPVAGGVCYSTAAALALTAAGTSRQVLQSGAAGAPTWTSDLLTSTTIGTAYIYRVGGTDVAVADGGTGKSSYAVGDILHATATGTLAGLADVAVGQLLASGGVGAIAAWTATPTVTTLTITGSVTNTTDAATKAYVDLAVSSLQLDEYFSATASSIGGIYYLMDPAPAGAGTVVSATITTSTTTAIFNFATAVAEPHLDRLVAGNYDIHAHLKQTNGAGLARTVTCYCELWTRVAGGTETLRGTSAATPAITTSDLFYDLYLNVPTEVALNLTDRLVVKWYAVTTGGIADVTVTMTVGGTANPHISVAVPSTELDQIFLVYSGATHDTDTGTFGITTAFLQVASGGGVRTGTTAGNTLLFQAYDTDTGPGYTTFATLTAGTTPTCNLSTSVTMGGAGILHE